jgi:hypothetical protein
MPYPVSAIAFNKTLEFYQEVVDAYGEATEYLKSFKWCKAIENCSLYTNIGKVFCIFLFEIENSDSSEDRFIWVIVGDIPSMYLDGYGIKTTHEVVETYIGLAEDWIQQIKSSNSVDECFPFMAEPTIELAELLEKKLSFMKGALINNIEDITIEC